MLFKKYKSHTITILALALLVLFSWPTIKTDKQEFDALILEAEESSHNDNTAEQFIYQMFPGFETRCRYFSSCKDNLSKTIALFKQTSSENILTQTKVEKISLDFTVDNFNKIKTKRGFRRRPAI